MFSVSKTQHKDTKHDRIHIVSDTPETLLAEAIKNPPEGSVKTEITPKLAEAMLGYNTKNRPLKANRLKSYTRQMQSGDWRYTRVPIIFSDKSRLLDGQHRLLSVVASGVSITADVAFGAPDEAFAFIDNGQTRTAGDIFAINDVKNHNVIAAIARVVSIYARGWALTDGGGTSNSQLTSAELYDFLCANPDIYGSMDVHKQFKKCRLANATLMAGLYVICARKSGAQADYFFDVVAEGFGAKAKNDPALALHKKFIEAATTDHKLTRRQTLGLTIHAWNRARDGLSGRGLKFGPEEKMPRVR